MRAGPQAIPSIEIAPGALARLQEVTGPVVYNRKFNFFLSQMPAGWEVVQDPAGEDGRRDALDLSLVNPDYRLRAAFQAIPVPSRESWMEEREDYRRGLEAGGRSLQSEEWASGSGLRWQVDTWQEAPGRTRSLFGAYRSGMGYGFEFWTESPTIASGELWAEEVRAVVRAFGIINPSGFVYNRQMGPGLLHDSGVFGYQVRSESEPGFAPGEALGRIRQDSGFIDFAHTTAEGALVVIIPFHLGSLRPNMDAVLFALSRFLGFDPTLTGVSDYRAYSTGDFRVREFRQANSGPDRSQQRFVRILGAPTHVFAAIVSAPADFPRSVIDNALAVVDGIELRPVEARFREGPALGSDAAQAHALICRFIGQFYLERGDPARALEFFQAATHHVPDFLGLQITRVDTLLQLRRFENALEVLKTLPRPREFSAALTARRAFALAETGEVDEALRAYQQACQEGLDDPFFLRDFTTRLMERGRADEAVHWLLAWVEESADPGLRVQLARAFLANGQSVRAEAELLAFGERLGVIPEAVHALADLYLTRDQVEAAVALIRRFLDPETDPSAAYGLGQAALRREDFHQARDWFAQAVRLSPLNPELRRMLDLTEAALGRRESGLDSDPIDPVPLPEGLWESLPALTESGVPEGTGAVYRRLGQAVWFSPGQPQKDTWFYDCRVLTAEGIGLVNEVSVEFSPLYERVSINRIRVWDASGLQVSEGETGGAYQVDDFSDGLVTDRKLLVIPIPGLVAGGRFELVVTRETRDPVEAPRYSRIWLARNQPSGGGVLWVAGMSEAVAHAHTESVTLEVRKDGLLWTAPAYVPPPPSAFPPPPHRIHPMVWLGPKGGTWSGLGREYAGRIANLLQPEPELELLSARLTAGLANPAGRARKLLAYVQDNLAYHGVLFGSRAQMPNPAGLVLARRYGDCKDFTVLLCQLLSGAGMPAFPALVNTRRDFHPGIVSLDQFDHMIVYLPETEGGLFLDPTDRSLPFGLPPRGLAGLPALIIDPAEPRLVSVPPYPADSFQVRVERSITPSASGLIEVREEVTFEGYFAAFVRDRLSGLPQNRHPTALRSLLDRSSFPAPMTDLQVAGLDDRASALSISYRYLQDNAFWPVGPYFTGRLPASWELYLLDLEPEDIPRQIPFWLEYPFSVQATSRWLPPPGWTVRPLPAPAQTSRFFTLAQDPSPSDQQSLSLTFTLQIPPGLFPAQDFHQFLQDCRSAAHRLASPVLLLQEK